MFIYGPTNAGRVRRHSTRQNENVAQMCAPPSPMQTHGDRRAAVRRPLPATRCRSARVGMGQTHE